MSPSRAGRLARIVVPFASMEVLTQIATAATGILVVRALPVQEFAVYAIAVSVQASLTVLSDVGISAVLLSRAGGFAADTRRMGQLLNAARALRLKLFGVVTLIAAPLLWSSLSAARPNVASWMLTLFLVLSTVALQISATVDGTMALALLRPARYQGGQLASSLVRLAGIVLLLAHAPLSWVGLTINLVGMAAQSIYLRWTVGRLIPREPTQNPEDRAAFRRTVRTQLINAGYYAFSSQITLWLVGLLSSARTVAEVGALGRISNILILAQSGIVALVAPRMARYAEPRLLLRRYLQVGAVAFVACTTVFILSWLFPHPFLWLIGPKYAGLGRYLPIAMGAALLYALGITIYSLNASRAWIEQAWMSIPLTLCLQAISLIWFDVSQLKGALLFGLCSSFPPLLVHLGIGAHRLHRELRSVDRGAVPDGLRPG
jgi:O-antigen/teichoic acid export membrane protein